MNIYDQLELHNDEVTVMRTRHIISHGIMVARRERADTEAKLARAEKLIQELYMKARDDCTPNQWNPYTWAELNVELMHRIKEFM